MWMYRLSGLTVALCGLAILIFITNALFTQTKYALHMVVQLGFPGVLLGTLVGALLVGFGVWLFGFWHPIHSRPEAKR